MPDDLHPKPVEKEMQEKVSRKLKTRGRKEDNFFLGIGAFGVIGWSVAIPTLLGIALGIWIDHHYPSQYSWTLMMLIFGVIIGCFNAWYWVHKEGNVL